MKKLYFVPSVQIMELTVLDVIADSLGSSEDGENIKAKYSATGGLYDRISYD